MSESTVKKVLLEEDGKFISKILVGVDINSWNETEQKKNGNSTNANNSVKIAKKLVFNTTKSKQKIINKYNTQQKKKQTNKKEEQQKNNEQKKLKSQSNYKKSSKQNCQQTKLKSRDKSQSGSNSSRNYRHYCDQFMKLPLVDVNKLAVQQNVERIRHGSKNSKPEIKIKSKYTTISTQVMNNVPEFRKSSLCKKQKKGLLRNMVQNWNIQTHSHVIRQIIKEKVIKGNFNVLIGDGVVLRRKINLAGNGNFGNKGKNGG